MLALTNPADDLDDLSGTYWTPPTEMEIAEAHPRLIQEVIARPGATIKLYYASLFEIPSACPVGHIEVAVDLTAGEACGILPFTRDNEPGALYAQTVTEPVWLKHQGELDDTMLKIYERLRSEGALA